MEKTRQNEPGKVRLKAGLGFFCAVGVSVGAAAEARELRLSLPASMHLDQRLEAFVEVRDSLGAPVATARSDGPLGADPFTISLEVPESDLVVRTMLLENGRPSMSSNAVPVSAGSDAIALGVVDLAPARPPMGAWPYLCGQTSVDVAYLPDSALLRIGAKLIELAHERSGSGARYVATTEPETEIWIKGAEMTIKLQGTILPICGPDLKAFAAPFEAKGNEPPWQITVGGGQVSFLLGYGADLKISGPASWAANGADVSRIEIGNGLMAVTAVPAITRDNMSGVPYPFAVTVEAGTEVLSGMGGDPARLLRGTLWRATEIGGRAIPPGAEPTLEFLSGRIAGSTGCNRFAGGYALTPEGLNIDDRLATTMMACPPGFEEMERSFLDALAQVARHDFAANGDLVLSGDAGEVLRLSY